MIACPGCGANLRFDIATQQMKCSYCGTQYDPQLFANMEKDAQHEGASAGRKRFCPRCGSRLGYDAKTDRMICVCCGGQYAPGGGAAKPGGVFDAWVYSCPQCGAELLTTDKTDAAAFCPYCGGSSIMLDKIRQEQAPDYVIPFRITKEECKRAYRKAARRAIFTPAKYKRPELVDGFRGIYMPYWSYEVEQKGTAKIKATGSTKRDGDYLVTENYDIEGEVDVSYDGYAHDASKAFDDEISECLAPFETAGRMPFSPGYLSGFYVDVADERSSKYRRDAEAYFEDLTARKLLADKGILAAASARSVRPGGISEVSIPTRLKKVDKVFYPVWFMSYRDRDRITYATVNGQTGKVVADFPVSPLRFLIGALLIAAAVFALLSFVLTLKPTWALVVTNILLTIGMIVCTRRIGKLKAKYGVAEKWIRNRRKNTGINAAKTVSVTLTILCIFASFIILVINPPYNAVFYIACFVEAGILFFMIVRSFGYQLSLAQRKPPQFNKKGGDDRA